MCEMFYNCSALYNFDISSLDTSKVIYMDCMFEDCSSLISLDISSFSTDMVTNMDDMFTSTSRLIMLKLGTDWEFLSDNGLTKSWLRLGDSTKYTAHS